MAFSNPITSITVPEGASNDDPRVVISTNDPALIALGEDAGIVWYWADQRAFVGAVQDINDDTDHGRLAFYAVVDGVPAGQFLRFDYIVSTGETLTSLVGTNIDIDSNDNVNLSAATAFIVDAPLIQIGDGFDPAVLLLHNDIMSVEKASHTIRGQHAIGTRNVNTFADMPGSPTITFIKVFDDTAIRMDIQSTVFCTGALDAVELGMQIDGVTYPLARYPFNTLSDQRQVVGWATATPTLPAGTYPAVLRWRRVAAAGTMNVNAGDSYTASVREIAP